MIRKEEATDQRKMVSNISFVDDLFSRRVLLLLEIAAMIVVVVLSFNHLFFLALIISFITLLLFVATLRWLYTRYQGLPVVREKKELERLSLKFQKRMQMEEKNVQAAIKGRADLFQAEKEESNTTLRTLQKNHIENGLAAASLQDATIDGIGEKFKERLAEYSIHWAGDITERISEVPGFGETKRQALIDWRSSVLQNLESTKPVSLPEKQVEAIQKKYRALQDENNAVHRRALASRQMLEYEVLSFRERLGQLAPFTFPRYLSRALASRTMVAVPLSLVLVLTQLVSSVSATASIAFSMMASVQRESASPIATPTTPIPSTETVSSTASPVGTFVPSDALNPLPTMALQSTDTALIP
jgi:hypothetical protein